MHNTTLPGRFLSRAFILVSALHNKSVGFDQVIDL